MFSIRQTLSNVSRLFLKYPTNFGTERRQVGRRMIHRWVAPTLHELYKRRQQLDGDDVPVEPSSQSPRSTYLEWNYDAEIYAFGKRLNENFNRDLLKQALINQSFIVVDKNSQNDVQSSSSLKHNQELIKEGDEILSNYIREEYSKYYPKDVVDALHQYLTSIEMLSHVAKYIGLTDIILTSEFPIADQTLADAFKAIVGALKSSTNLQRTELFIKDFLLSQMNGKEIYDIWMPPYDNNYGPYEYLKNLLKQYNNDDDIEPRLCQQSAVNTIMANYQVGLYNEQKKLLGIGWGESIEIAKNTAALDAIQRIIHEGSNSTTSLPPTNP